MVLLLNSSDNTTVSARGIALLRLCYEMTGFLTNFRIRFAQMFWCDLCSLSWRSRYKVMPCSSSTGVQRVIGSALAPRDQPRKVPQEKSAGSVTGGGRLGVPGLCRQWRVCGLAALEGDKRYRRARAATKAYWEKIPPFISLSFFFF